MTLKRVFLSCVLGVFFCSGTIAAESASSLTALWSLIANSDAQQIKALAVTHLWFSLLICFFSGVLTSLTPCVYPMIPITISIFTRAAQQGLGKKHEHKAFNKKTFWLAAIYVAGMSFTYSVMGLIAGLTGSLFGRIMQSPVVTGLLVIIFLALAIGQLGFFELAIPSSWQSRLNAIGSAENRIGIFLMGLISGLVISPCVGPVIAGILAFVFESSNAIKGSLFFLSFSLGLGILFLLIGGFSGLVNRLPRSGPWMKSINMVLAGLMIIAAGYYSVVFLRQMGLRKSDAPISKEEVSVAWQTNEAAAFEASRREGKPILVDFAAEWCTVCLEIDALVFKDKKVEARLKNFVTLRIDVTNNTPANSQILRKYGVMSLPAIVFVDKTGRILEKPRIHSLITAEEFLQVIEKL